MKQLLVLLSVTAGISSCISSVYPIVTEENIVYEKSLLGRWKQDTGTVLIESFLKSSQRVMPDSRNIIERPKNEEEKRIAAFFRQTYMVSYNYKGESYVLEGRLARIGNHLFLELFPHTYNSDERHHLPNHEKSFSVAKINVEPGRVILRFIDGKKLQSLIVSGQMKLKHEYEKLFDVFLITAPTPELHLFLKKYGDDKRLYRKEVIILTKQKQG